MRRIGLLLVGSLFAAPAIAASAPNWMLEASRAPIPDSIASAPGVILLDESDVTLGPDGVVRSIARRAIRVLDRTGIERCLGYIGYRTDSGRLSDVRGWVIGPDGGVRTIDKDGIADMAVSQDPLYDESRYRVVDGRRWAEPGATFGWEATKEENALYTTFSWWFQDRLPVVQSRFSLTVPPGSEIQSWTFHHAPIDPVVTGPRRTWQLDQLPGIEEDSDGPRASSVAARIGVSVVGPAAQGRSFKDWSQVARWLDDLSSSRGQGSPEVVARARALVSGAASRIDSVRAIGRFVQSLRYASIQLGLGSGGGYRPHRPEEVLEHEYGDCKDKANLMRAMLAGVGIDSRLVVVSSIDPDFVQVEWPAAEQFDHCVIGVTLPARVSDAAMASLVEAPEGRMLIFDPTSTTTTLGDLPTVEQGSLALIVSPRTRTLVRLPELASTSGLERRTEIVLAADGSARGSVREQSRGQAAALERSLVRDRNREDYRRLVETWLAGSVGGAQISAIDVKDDSIVGRFGLEVTFHAPRLGQMVQDRLMLVRPAIVSRHEGIARRAEGARRWVALEAEAVRESAFVVLPEGFAVDELPQAVRLDSEFGTYASSCTAVDQRVIYSRSLTVRRLRAGPERYDATRAFFDRIHAAEQAPIVLARR